MTQRSATAIVHVLPVAAISGLLMNDHWLKVTWDHVGMRATGSDDLILEGAEIPEAYAVDVRTPED